jgi:MFS family permease
MDEKAYSEAVHRDASSQQSSDYESTQRSGIYQPDTHGFTADEATLPKGYFRSFNFIGTILATGLGLCAAVGGFGLAAPNLAFINADIGPDPNIIWVSLVYTLTMAIGLLLVGRLSDLFGRRWFFIGAAALALVGCIVCATAQSVGAVIAGTTLIGLAASGQQSFAFITGELVPMKVSAFSEAENLRLTQSVPIRHLRCNVHVLYPILSSWSSSIQSSHFVYCSYLEMVRLVPEDLYMST